ncbi:hypothetical protein DPMN_067932 [Dreissena polymorpha]|uniref:Uncharacterized protein n=1 Tax=Dreissena polymorpha TaxID=45954 RepID=A0A9D3YW58_DREPO|nr:hypothetical protein DPMN_067932 [Dreissena polymorpha]
MCVPSIAATQFGKFQFVRKPSASRLHFFRCRGGCHNLNNIFFTYTSMTNVADHYREGILSEQLTLALDPRAPCTECVASRGDDEPSQNCVVHFSRHKEEFLKCSRIFTSELIHELIIDAKLAPSPGMQLWSSPDITCSGSSSPP